MFLQSNPISQEERPAPALLSRTILVPIAVGLVMIGNGLIETKLGRLYLVAGGIIVIVNTIGRAAPFKDRLVEYKRHLYWCLAFTISAVLAVCVSVESHGLSWVPPELIAVGFAVLAGSAAVSTRQAYRKSTRYEDSPWANIRPG